MVYFWATWCMPCRTMTPVIEDLSQEYYGKIKIVKINVDESETIATKYGIRGIPTLVLFKEGKILTTMIGVLSKEKISNQIGYYL